MPTYTQPARHGKAWTAGRPDGDVGVQTPGIDCIHCGQPGHEHKRTREKNGDGRWRYQFVCPGGDD